MQWYLFKEPVQIFPQFSSKQHNGLFSTSLTRKMLVGPFLRLKMLGLLGNGSDASKISNIQ